MDFRIADTFTDSLPRLTGDELKAFQVIKHVGHQPIKGFKS